MTTYIIYVLALLIGVVAGLRTMTPLAAVSWAAHLGALKLEGTWLAFLGSAVAPWILTVAAIAELVTDRTAAFLEDAVAIVGVALIVGAFA